MADSCRYLQKPRRLADNTLEKQKMSRRTCRAVTVILCLCFLLGSCSMSKTKSSSAGDFTKLTEDFVYGTLALSPITATQAGYHIHQGVALDETLDDMGP